MTGLILISRSKPQDISLQMEQKVRCFGEGKPFYEAYHDEEWGVPVHDDRVLFEMLILEGAQAGLSWELVLKRREVYRECFHGFDPAQVARMDDQALDRLCANPGLIRNRRKIYSARINAEVFLRIQEKYGSFDRFLWDFVDGRPILNSWSTKDELPCETELSRTLSKALKKAGMSFVGPTIIYSFLQAVGVVNDHLTSCWCYAKYAKQRS